jgi:predicted XRE-type DNA-binding protein
MSKNPFLDLGFPPEEAAALHIRCKSWTQVAAARELKVPQPTISKIVNVNIEKLSIEFLIKLMVRAGLAATGAARHSVR